MLFSYLFSKLYSCVLIAKKMRYEYKKNVLIVLDALMFLLHSIKKKYSNNYFFMPS